MLSSQQRPTASAGLDSLARNANGCTIETSTAQGLPPHQSGRRMSAGRPRPAATTWHKHGSLPRLSTPSKLPREANRYRPINLHRFKRQRPGRHNSSGQASSRLSAHLVVFQAFAEKIAIKMKDLKKKKKRRRFVWGTRLPLHIPSSGCLRRDPVAEQCAISPKKNPLGKHGGRSA